MKKISILITSLFILVALVYWISAQAPIAPNDDGENKAIVCEDMQRGADFCIQIYDPVCALVQIQCITTPCDPIEQTFSNSCEACKNSLVLSYIKGACN